MLDSIISAKIKEDKISFYEKEKKEIKNIFENKLNTFDNSDIVSRSNLSKDEYNNIKKNIVTSCLLGNKKPYLYKIKELYNTLSDETKKIIDFSDELFELLKESRNNIAHANKLSEKFYEKSNILYYKTLLFICYLIWKDLGLDDKAIWNELCPHTNIKLYCNEKELYKYKKGLN
jgi:hypothetical protein